MTGFVNTLAAKEALIGGTASLVCSYKSGIRAIQGIEARKGLTTNPVFHAIFVMG